jgi:hypothetical protein
MTTKARFCGLFVFGECLIGGGYFEIIGSLLSKLLVFGAMWIFYGCPIKKACKR